MLWRQHPVGFPSVQCCPLLTFTVCPAAPQSVLPSLIWIIYWDALEPEISELFHKSSEADQLASEADQLAQTTVLIVG